MRKRLHSLLPRCAVAFLSALATSVFIANALNRRFLSPILFPIFLLVWAVFAWIMTAKKRLRGNLAVLLLFAAILVGSANILSVNLGSSKEATAAVCAPTSPLLPSSGCSIDLEKPKRTGSLKATSKGSLAAASSTASRMIVNATLFYNIFLPNLDNALDIVQEQFTLIQESYINNQTKPTIYFNTMGEKAIEGGSRVQELCQKAALNCIHLTSQMDGDEILTLQALYEYCNRNNNETTERYSVRVGYLHNKGSFHDTAENARLRVPFTNAITSESCWNPPNQSCTSCGLVFLDLPFMTMPGNFFVSRCDYIGKLIPPKDFEAAQQRLLQAARPVFPETLGYFANGTAKSFQNRDSWLGVGRYASEHWAHSHPDLMPCDLSQRLAVWFRRNPNQHLKFQMYPRPALAKNVRNHHQVEFEDYYGMAGLIFKWYFLYDAIPPRESWVWERLPNGTLWREGVAKFGRNVTSRMRRQHH